MLTQGDKGTDTLYFTYDAGGAPTAVTYNGTTYYYVTNLQGDIVAILDSTGTSVVNYTYDAWGNPLSRTGTMKNTLGILNPLRYRGYVYDNETELYYLQSRYYKPSMGRFINADGLISTGQGILGHNMFAYCGNNPVYRIDPTGNCYYNANGVWCHDNWEYLGGYQRKPDPGYYQGTTPSGLGVYVAQNINYATPLNAVKVVDKRDTNTSNGVPNPDIQIINSYKYTDRVDQAGILTLIDKYVVLNPSTRIWKRTQSSLFIEWDLHNVLYGVFGLNRFRDADFDNDDEHMLVNLWNRIFQ